MEQFLYFNFVITTALFVIALMVYLFFFQDMRKSRMFQVREIGKRLRPEADRREGFKRFEEERICRRFHNLVRYNQQMNGAVLTWNNRVQIFSDGEELFTDLRNHLREARKYIHIQYYIIKNDELFDSIVPILVEKARQGVEVRILCDGMGTRSMPKERWRQLEAQGIRIGIFFPAFLGRFHFRMNYRNHRKLVVIDGRIGYVGGFNIGKEYIGKDPKFGYWRDTHLRLEGEAVISLQIRFALDWNYAVKENLFQQDWYFHPQMPEGEMNPLGIQVIASGPDSINPQIRDNYLALFHQARKYIYIQTPYFVPDDEIMTALTMAARSGVEVRLMFPCMPDHPFVYWATCYHMGRLLEAGGKCYVYEGGFLHAKGVTVDGLVSCYGTANMDIRSFKLNFEVNAVIFDEKTARQLEEIFHYDLTHCLELTPELYRQRSMQIRFREWWSRLLSPIL